MSTGFLFGPAYGLIVQGWVAAQNGDSDGWDRAHSRGFDASRRRPGRGYSTRVISGCSPRLWRLPERLRKALRSSTTHWPNRPPPARGAGTQRFTACAASSPRRLPYPDPAKAEESFRTALAIAREQGTRGYELRAATSLARLWREQGRRAEARDLLAPVYGWFTEGFDTADLKDAKMLLDELA